MQMYAVKDSVVVYQMPDSVKDDGLLTVLDRATGAQRWTRVLREGQMILHTESEDPNILLQDGLMLQALNPKDGAVAWSVTGRGDIHRDLQTHPYYAYGNIGLPLQPERGAADRLYVVLNGLPVAFDREKGTLLWEMPVTTHESASAYTMDEMAKTRYAVLSRYLLLGYGSDMLVLGKQDGQVVGRLSDNQIAFREARYRKGIEGLLNMEGDEIYIGSSNGGLAKYSVKALESQLDQVK